jgi:septum formation protein
MDGRTLEITTAVCVGRPGAAPHTVLVTTLVALRRFREGEIARYVASGAGDDKAGGLALQAEAAPFIASTRGCWSNVVGLPLCAVASLLDVAPTGATQQQRCNQQLCGRAPSG